MMAAGNYNGNHYPGNADLSEQLADIIATQLASAISARGRAVIAVSGGSTPKPLFKALSKLAVEWSKVVITLVDERWVDEDSALSNAAFLKANLLDLLPEQSNFVPLYYAAETVEASLTPALNGYCSATKTDLSSPAQFDIVVLGMGQDGHTASFFPDAENIAELVDPDSQTYLLSCESPSTQVPRITWSLPMLLNTELLALHITGQTKKTVFEQAVEGNDSTELPIRAAIHQRQTLLNVYYAD